MTEPRGTSRPPSPPAPPLADTEIELKLLADSATFEKLLRAQRLATRKPVSQQDTYFDTAEARLRDSRWALRVREKSGKFIQTLKGEANVKGLPLGTRPEFEWPIEAARPDPSLMADLAAVPVVTPQELTPLVKIAVDRRTTLSTRPDRSQVEMAFDTGEIRAGNRKAPLCEIELELKRGSPAAVYEAALALHRKAPLRIGLGSKLDRALGLRDGDQGPAPVLASGLTLRRDVSADHGLKVLLRWALAHAVANERPTELGHDPEGVHQLRVALRRLRSIFRLFGPLLAGDEVEGFIADIRWLGQELGFARDLDVLATEILPTLAAELEDQADLAVLSPLLNSERRRAQQKAARAIRDPRTTDLWLRLGCYIERHGWLEPTGVNETDPTDPLGEAGYDIIDPFPAQLPLRAVVSGRLTKLDRRITRHGDGLDWHVPERCHDFRIRIKRLRYAADLAAPLFPVQEVKRLKAGLKGLQELLGDQQDLAIAAHRLMGLRFRSAAQRRTAEVAAGRLDAQVAMNPKMLKKAWISVRNLKRFWAKGKPSGKR